MCRQVGAGGWVAPYPGPKWDGHAFGAIVSAGGRTVQHEIEIPPKSSLLPRTPGWSSGSVPFRPTARFDRAHMAVFRSPKITPKGGKTYAHFSTPITLRASPTQAAKRAVAKPSTSSNQQFRTIGSFSPSPLFRLAAISAPKILRGEKAYSTQCSQVVAHLSTNWA